MRSLLREVLLGKTVIATALAAAFYSTIAAGEQGATLVSVEGDAVVSKGAQYVGGTEGMALEIGARVMALAASSAVIQFSDGCRYVLAANELLTIEEQSPCALGLVSAGATATNLAWVPPAAAGIVAIMGATFSTGDTDGDSARGAISP